jgi:hypothetical protein
MSTDFEPRYGVQSIGELLVFGLALNLLLAGDL